MKTVLRFTVFCLCAVLITSAASCSSGGSSGDARGSLTEAEKKYGQLNEGKPITIRVELNNYTPTVNKEATAENPKVFLSTDHIVTKFKEMFPNVSVEYDRTKDSDWSYWMSVQVAAGTAPDIVFLHGSQYSDRGWLLRLNEIMEEKNPFVEKYDRWKDMYPEYVWDSYEVSDAADNILAVPYTLYPGTATAYFYNKEIFKKLGLTPQREWKNFIADCKKINDAGYIAVGPWVVNKTIALDLWDIQYSLGPTYSAKLAKQWDLDGNSRMSQYELYRAAHKGVFNASNPALLDMYARVKEKYNDVLQVGAVSTDYESLWNQGKVAMMEDGLWRLPQEQANTLRKFDFGVMPVPIATSATSQYAADITWEKGPYQPPVETAYNIVKPSVEAKGAGATEVCVRFLQWLTVPENLDMVVLEFKGSIGAAYGVKIPPELNEWLSNEFPRIPSSQWVCYGPTYDSKQQLSKQLEMWIRGMVDDKTFIEGYDRDLKAGVDKLFNALNVNTKDW